MPFFSIIIPVFNSQDFLRKCVDSVLEQAFDDIEIIIINDCSTDATNQICESYKDNSNIKIIFNKKNFGVGKSRNIGREISSGKFIIFLDSDDRIYKDTLNELKQLIESKSNCDVVVCKFSAEQYPKDNNYLFSKEFSYSFNSEEFISHINNANYRPNVCWHYIYNSKFLNKHELNFVDARIGEDQEFIAKVLCLAQNFIFYNNNFYHHRSRLGSLRYTIDLMATESFLKIIISLIEFSKSRKFSYEKNIFIRKKIFYLIGEFSARIVLHKDKELENSSILYNTTKFCTKLSTNYIYNKKFENLINSTSFKNNKNLLNYQKEVYQCIEKRFKDLKYKLVYIFCATVYGLATLKILNKNNIKVEAFIDDSEVLQSQTLNGVKILSSSILKNNPMNQDTLILVSNQRSNTFDEISDKIISEYKFKQDKIVHILFD